MSQIKITDGKGFRLTFPNDYCLSVQIGGGNYCDNYDFPIGGLTRENPLPASSKAEIALFSPTGEWMKLSEHDEIRGYEPVQNIFRFIGFLNEMPKGTTSEQFYDSYSEFSWSGY